MLIIALFLLVLICVLVGRAVSANDGSSAQNGRLVTFHDGGKDKVILTHAHTVRDALKDAHIVVTSKDTIEPQVDSEFVATDYTVNIYRARPIIVVDGAVRQKVMTAAQTPSDIVNAAELNKLQDEDKTTFSANSDMVTDGASSVLTIDRAVPVKLQLYGTPTTIYSHESTVGEMLKKKGITLQSTDHVSTALTAPVVADMAIAIWRDGIQTATVTEPIAFTSRQILDVDQPIGYHVVQTAGVNGTKSVTYQITALAGQETGRTVIQTVTLQEPVEQVEIIGAKPGNGLTKAKGADTYTDSKGVSHRETYYDLSMNSVMGACGGGTYTIRSDGAKVDKDGYILVAANFGNYPRCTVVETSMGLGKVYDTGGFASRYPQAFDLATDWSNYDGR